MNNDYLDLLIRVLNGDLSDSVIFRNIDLHQARESGYRGNVMASIDVCRELLEKADVEFRSYLGEKSSGEVLGMSPEELFEYLNWMNPIDSPHTMGGMANLENVRFCCEEVLKHGVPGDFIETGVWKGGMTIWMRGILKAWDCTDRKVWVADSFEGLPRPDPKTQLKDAIFWFLMTPLQQLAVPFEYTEALFERYNLLDDQVKFLKGWFHETLPHSGIEKLAVLRLDGDLYESTRVALDNLYPKLSVGGYLIIDDYGVPCGCRQAVDEFRREHSIHNLILPVTKTSVYWQKT